MDRWVNECFSAWMDVWMTGCRHEKRTKAMQAYRIEQLIFHTAAAGICSQDQPVLDQPNACFSLWIEGLNRLRVCLAVANACNFVAFIACRLDGSVGPGVKQLSDAWYHNFMVRNQQLSDAWYHNFMVRHQA